MKIKEKVLKEYMRDFERGNKDLLFMDAGIIINLTLAEVLKVIDEMLEKQRLEYKRCKDERTTRMKNANTRNWGMAIAEEKNRHYNQVKQKLSEGEK